MSEICLYEDHCGPTKCSCHERECGSSEYRKDVILRWLQCSTCHRKQTARQLHGHSLYRSSSLIPSFTYSTRTFITNFFLLLTICSLAFLRPVQAAKIYTNTWAIHIDGGPDVADRIAKKHGFTNLGKIFEDDSYYHFRHGHVHKRSIISSHYHHGVLTLEPEVRWSQQQHAKRRVKRDFVEEQSRRLLRSSSLFSSSQWPHIKFSDPDWPEQWYLNRGGGLDMNVEEAWSLGYTGKGVVVTILDDGIEYTHPDLQYNYDPLAGYDVNDHEPDPIPRYDYTNENKHGTRCAGEVAAQSDNRFCSVGVAFNASIGGVRMLDGEVTDAVEAMSLSLNPQHIHIYSASWGPDDDGRTVDGPADMARKAFHDGVTKGRGGLGSIFVWASGNGGRMLDSCNCDGYTNSMYTLSISSATESGQVPWYSEACSSTLATTYSSGSVGERQIVTTDLRHSCTSRHTGTSASAPLAAAIVALALEANPRLTWRDMQHIVVETAKPRHLHAPDWIVTGAGKKVSHSFGFGLMDAGDMVKLARKWATVPDQHHCEIIHPNPVSMIPALGSITLHMYMDGCLGSRNDVRHLEHVFSKVSITAQRRGALHIYLTSPMGTMSTLLPKRARDISTQGFRNWSFMTTHSWGESPRGNWTLQIINDGALAGRFESWSLLMLGTAGAPFDLTPSTTTTTPTPIITSREPAHTTTPISTTTTSSPIYTRPQPPSPNNVHPPVSTKNTDVLDDHGSVNSGDMTDSPSANQENEVGEQSQHEPSQLITTKARSSSDVAGGWGRPVASRNCTLQSSPSPASYQTHLPNTWVSSIFGDTAGSDLHSWNMLFFGTATPPQADGAAPHVTASSRPHPAAVHEQVSGCAELSSQRSSTHSGPALCKGLLLLTVWLILIKHIDKLT